MTSLFFGFAVFCSSSSAERSSMTRESSALRQVWNRVTSMPSSQNRELNSGSFAFALEEVPRTSS